jgi:hypothetical protein
MMDGLLKSTHRSEERHTMTPEDTKVLTDKMISDADKANLHALLMDTLREGMRAAKLTDKELANEAIVKVWGRLKLGKEEEAIVDELIRRFQKLAGIPEYEDVD